jgi:hypothetical protein
MPVVTEDGTVALSVTSHGRRSARAQAIDGRGCRGEASPSHPTRPAAQFSVHRFRFPPEVILIAVRWYLRYGLSYRDLEKLLAERGIEVDHVTLFRRVQRFTPLLIDAARPCRHSVGGALLH